MGVVMGGSSFLVVFLSDGSSSCSATWSADGKTLSWTHYKNESTQLNYQNYTYQVVALIIV